MITNWPAAQKAGRSPLNIGRSLERNVRKQARTAENNKYRADLHRQKVNARNPEDANRIQGQINEISKRV